MLTKLITYVEAARILGVPLGTVHSWVSTGRVDIPYIRLSGRTVRFDEDELRAWIEERRERSRHDYDQRHQAERVVNPDEG